MIQRLLKLLRNDYRGKKVMLAELIWCCLCDKTCKFTYIKVYKPLLVEVN